MNLGNSGDYYLDNISKKMYFKVPKHYLDHVNSDTMDNRTENIREISAGANTANKVKGKNLSSNYIGVSKEGNRWRGKVTYNGKSYKKRFDVEYDAAKFRDIYVIRFYKMIMTNNGTLTEEEINDIIERGARAIPEKYRLKRKKERELPKHISKKGEKYQCSVTFPEKKNIKGNLRNTIEEAQADLVLILAEREELRMEEERLKLSEIEELKKKKY